MFFFKVQGTKQRMLFVACGLSRSVVGLTEGGFDGGGQVLTSERLISFPYFDTHETVSWQQ